MGAQVFQQLGHRQAGQLGGGQCAIDGITASPKTRQTLNERKANASAAITVAPAPAMACPKCGDVLKAEVNRQAKGAEVLTGAATKTVAHHTCAGCNTTIATLGFGKAKYSVATHKCTADVPNNSNCCAAN